MRCIDRRQRGLTLLEMMVAIAIVAVLASLAVPGFGATLSRLHLKAAAERVAADLSEARFEATRRGQAVHLHFEPGAHWCYAVALAPACGCGSAQPCQIRQTLGRDHAGVVLEQAQDLHFDPSAGTASVPAALRLRSSHGERLQVELTRLGRAKVCAPDGSTPGYPAC
jgi:type IV fimbrial biogenesis protein FimT